MAPVVPLEGGCNDANCDCVEFFLQAVAGLINWETGWYSSNMPQYVSGDQSSYENMLSEEFKSMVRNE